MTMPQPVVLKPETAAAELDIQEIPHDHSKDIVAANALLVVEANKHRTACWFVNNSDVQIFIGLGYEPTITTGIPLNAMGGAWELNKSCLFKGDIYAIAAIGAAKRLHVVELESRYAY